MSNSLLRRIVFAALLALSAAPALGQGVICQLTAAARPMRRGSKGSAGASRFVSGYDGATFLQDRTERAVLS
jgi:hypothetical protein